MWEAGVLQGHTLSAASPSPLNVPYIYHDMLEELLTVLNGIDVINAYEKLAYGHRRALLQTVPLAHTRPCGMCYSLGLWGLVGARTPWGHRVVGNSHRTHVAGSSGHKFTRY